MKNTDYEELAKKVKTYASANYQEAVNIRRKIHRNPELSFREYETTRFISDTLYEYGIDNQYTPLETGVIAEIGDTGAPGPTVVLKADIDALPIEEKTGVDYCSRNNKIMHACGHDAHSAVLLITAKILNVLREHINGKVIIVFQPGEELLPGGAKYILDNNILSAYNPSCVMALHSMPELNAGSLGFRKGSYMASGDEIYLNVTGKGGHAAMPHTLIDPVLIASHILTSLQNIVSRNAPPAIPTVLSFGRIIGDGAMNVIPQNVRMDGTFRTFDEEWRGEAHQHIERNAKGIAQAMGGDCDVDIVNGYPSLYNNPRIVEKVESSARNFWHPENIINLPQRMTTDDFARFSRQYPAVMYRIGTHNPEWQEYKSLHSPYFDIDEQALYHGVLSLVWSTINVLND